MVGRSAGILLHPTSLPGPHGVGELGPEAVAFLDFLAETGQTLWQVLPLGPTGYGDSPYQCFSAFAGNPVLISLVKLRDDGLLDDRDLKPGEDLPEREVDFGALLDFKRPLLARACAAFREGASPERLDAFEAFRSAQSAWLPDYALFAALKRANGGVPWYEWEAGLARRDPPSLDAARRDLATEVQGVFWPSVCQRGRQTV